MTVINETMFWNSIGFQRPYPGTNPMYLNGENFRESDVLKIALMGKEIEVDGKGKTAQQVADEFNEKLRSIPGHCVYVSLK